MATDDVLMNPVHVHAQIDKPMPQAREAEMALLSAMLISPEVFDECLVSLEPDDFYMPTHRKIFLALRKMSDKSLPIDTISLADYLASTNELEVIGGRAFLLELANNTMSLVGWKRHIEMLRRDRTLRAMIEASAKITALAYDAPEDTKEVVDRAEQLLLSVTNRDIKRTEITLADLTEQLIDEMQDPDANVFKGIKTGFKRIDECLLGLREGQMVVIGARPGVGKTSFALTLALNTAKLGAKVVFFSLEMSRTEIIQRLLSSESRVPLQMIRGGQLGNDQWLQLMPAADTLASLDVVIDDTSGMTVTDIRAKARRILHDHTNAVVIVDYLQLISPPQGERRADSRATEVSEMSRAIKIMAKDLGVPVVALSQLNRTVENRTGKRPQLSDLRESGSIEQDADIVALLDRSMNDEEAGRDDRPDKDETVFIIAKNRSGALADVKLRFLPGSTKFVEVDINH